MKTFTFEIGGREFTLTASFEALALIEQSCEQGLFEIIDNVVEMRPRLSVLINCVHAGVRASGERGITKEFLHAFLSKHKFYGNPKVCTAIVDFLNALMMAGVDSEEQKKSGQEQPTQSSSSRKRSAKTK